MPSEDYKDRVGKRVDEDFFYEVTARYRGDDGNTISLSFDELYKMFKERLLEELAVACTIDKPECFQSIPSAETQAEYECYTCPWCDECMKIK